MAQTLDHNSTVVSVTPVEVPSMDADVEVIQKLDDEPNDKGGLTAAQLKAAFDEAGMKIKNFLNNRLIPTIIADDLTEEERALAEAERVSNEIERVSNENARVLAENGRVNAEASRVLAEQARENTSAEIANNPPIIYNGHWLVYNATNHAYEDTGINATGPAGSAGPNLINSSTSTSLTGFLKGDGTHVYADNTNYGSAFVATFGTTSAADIEAAYQAGRILTAVYPSYNNIRSYEYYRSAANDFTFFYADNNSVFSCNVDGGGWTKTDWLTYANKANAASPALTGTPTAPTAAETNKGTQIATTAFTYNVIDRALKIMHASTPIALTSWNQLIALQTGFYVVTNDAYVSDSDNRITVPYGSNFLYVETDVNDFLPAYSSLTVFIDPLTRTPYGAYDPEMGEAYNDLDPATYASIMDDAYSALSTFAGIPQTTGGGGDNTFVAEYGVTPFADIAAAAAANKVITCESTGVVYYFMTIDDSGEHDMAVFVANGGLSVMAVMVDDEDNWDDAMISLAPLASPALTGTPTAPTATAGTNTTQIATTAFVAAAISAAITDAIGGNY